VLKRVDRSDAVAGLPAAADATWAQLYPALHEYLTVTKWDDGKAREVATLMLVAESGFWKVCVNDRANARSAWFSGISVEACLLAVEDAISQDAVAWRPTKPYQKR
jgi:hypothetical protein